VDNSGHLATHYKDTLSIIRPDHPDITGSYSFRAENVTIQILRDYHQTYVLPIQGTDPFPTVIGQSDEQMEPKPSGISIEMDFTASGQDAEEGTMM
jgi:hypothetical protein